MKRTILLVLTATIAAGFAFSAGGADKPQATGKEAPAFAYDYPDNMPKVPAPVDPSAYAYDDMSKKYSFEVLSYGYVVQPVKDDPIKAYLNKKLNADITWTDVPSADLTNSITVRFASGNPPDFVHSLNRDVARSLYEQGQTMTIDGVIQYLPQARQYITKSYKEWITLDGKMYALPRYPTFADNWGYFIRADWLKKFGMAVPKTDDEIFAFAKASAEKDPDGNGKADTWFMGSAGGGKSGFQMMEHFQNMYGHPGYNVKDGKINHPMVDGSRKKFIEFIKKLYDAKTLHPDWYTIEWEHFKTYSMNDQIGMVFYPGWNLAQETYDAHKKDLNSISVWAPLDPLKASSGTGGQYAPGGAPGGVFMLSKQLEKDQGKLKRVLHWFDSVIYPNENYWAVSQGGDENIYPGMSRKSFDKATGTNVFELFRDKHPAYTDPALNPLWNWQTIGYTLIWQVYDDPMGKIGSNWNQKVIQMPRYKNYDLFLALDNETVQKISEFTLRNEIQFVLGQRSMNEWDAYVAEWKAAGGQKLLDQAAAQLKVGK